ncbi:hypothetical protein ACEPPN_004454 [Leptodophora sp. 'Broadleaf-Isolate-01']
MEGPSLGIEKLCFSIASHADDILGIDSAMFPQQFNRDSPEELYSNITDDLRVASQVISSSEFLGPLVSGPDGFDEYGFIATSLVDHALSTDPGTIKFSRKFPEEIYLNIISQVDDIPTLAALSLVSKTSHEFAESYLYSTLDTARAEALPLVMRTVLEKPHFGRYVKYSKWVYDPAED